MNDNAISLDEIFSFIGEKGPVIVAVSGGSDSMAALFLANAWAKKTGREIHAVTVDHGLRSEAAAEAAFVAMVCDGLDIIHTTLSWDGIKPPAGISAAARNARYDLMEEFATDIGIRIILTGHTSDDQAETVLMRLRRSEPGSGGRGHSGMCKRTLLGGGALLLRPFLSLSRQRLRAYLNEVSQGWIEDPSNFDESYERVRVRAELAKTPEIRDNILKYSKVMGRARQVLSQAAANLLGETCVCRPGHIFELDSAKFREAAQPVSAMAIKTVIAAAGGAQYLVSDSQLQQVAAAMSGEHSARLTLGNCIINADRRRIEIYREARNLKSQLVEVGESVLWDGRVHVTNDSKEDVRIEAMSQETLEETFEAMSEGGKAPIIAGRKAALISSPLLITASGLSIPLYFDKTQLPAQIDVRTGARALENFCPQWDYALLDWLKAIDLATDHGNLSHSSVRKAR